MDAYLTKQDKWLKNLVPHPLCFGCATEFETWDHLMFQCNRFAKIREVLRISTLIDVWQENSGFAQKFSVALLSSWMEEMGIYLKYFIDHFK